MVRENGDLYQHYIDAISEFSKIPSQLQNSLVSAQKKAAQVADTVKNEQLRYQERYTRLRSSAEVNYNSIRVALEEAGVSIPLKQHPMTHVSVSASSAFEDQKRLGEYIVRKITDLKNQKRNDESSTALATEALRQRKLLAQKQLEEEAKLRAEEEQKRLQEESEQLKLGAKRKFSFDFAGLTITIGKKENPSEKG